MVAMNRLRLLVPRHRVCIMLDRATKWILQVASQLQSFRGTAYLTIFSSWYRGTDAKGLHIVPNEG
jgi:hypothetical protein